MKAPVFPRSWPVLLAALPVLLYFLLFIRFSVDIPFGDDYGVLSFILNFTNPHVPGKTALLFSQHNEHRIVTLRLALLLLHQAFRRIDFVLVALIGNLGLLGLARLAARMPGPESLDRPAPLSLPWAAAAVWIPPAWLLFQPQHHEILQWAMCSFTNVFVLLFAFLSLYFLTRRDGIWAFGLSIALSVLAAYTNGNGVFVFFVGLAVLAFLKKYHRLAWWAGCGLLSIGFYFLGFVRNPEHPAFADLLKTGVFRTGEYFLSLVGSFADFGQRGGVVPVAAGFVLLAGTGIAFGKRLHRKNMFLSASMVFLLLSFAANALTRAPMGLFMAFMPRYKLLSVLMLLLLYFSALETGARKKPIILGFAAFSVVYGGYSFVLNYPTVRDRVPVLSVNMAEWSGHQADLPYPNAAHAEAILRAAWQRRIYQPPPKLGILRPRYPFGAIDGGSNSVIAGRDEVLISGWALAGSGSPSVLVRKEGPGPAGDPALPASELHFAGKAVFKAGTVPGAERDHFGFPGLDRMLWEFQAKRAELGDEHAAADVRLSFFARDGAGRETYLGMRTVRFEDPEKKAR